MMLRHRAVLAVLLLSPLASAAAQVVRRYAPDSMWRRVWTVGVGAGKQSEVFVEPRKVVVTSDLVTVLDLGTREVRGFDARTGAARFTVAARGNGPGEFKRPAELFATPTGFAVLDLSNARLSAYDGKARPTWHFVMPDVFSAASACIRRDGTVLVSYRRPDTAIAVLDTTGKRVGRQHVAWSKPRPTPIGFAHEAYLSHVTDDGRCALTRHFGGEWAVVGGSARVVSAWPLVEVGDEPRMHVAEEVLERSLSRKVTRSVEGTETTSIANNILLRADTAIVMGGETKRFPYRMLDYYHLTTGAYLYSRKLPFILNAVAIGADGTYYGTVIGENTQALVAFRPERLTPALLQQLKASATRAKPDTLARPKPPAGAPPRDFR